LLSSTFPLSGKTHQFLTMAFSCPIVQVYSVAEACGVAALSLPGDLEFQHLGAPIASIEIKLVDVPQMGFRATNEVPMGEICLRGPAVTQGYLRDEEATGQAFDDDEWYHTGDIGAWSRNGSLTFVDRKSNIISLSTGAFVALERLENIYLRSQFVKQIFVYGEEREPCLVAVINVHPNVIKTFAATRNVREQFTDPDDLASLCENSKMHNFLISHFRNIAKDHKPELKPSDLVRAVYLDVGEWTCEDGLVTPTGRIRRAALEKKYGRQLSQQYEDLKSQAKEALEREGMESPSVDVGPSPTGENEGEEEGGSSGETDSEGK